jgi:tRNA(adenine34) deaminase
MHEYFMSLALEEARKSYILDEVPVGAVVVKDGRVIAKAHNSREIMKDATAHAEIIAIREACRTLGGWRLMDCDIYVTLEPCPMCAGALVQSRIQRLVYGADDPKAGSAGTLLNLLQFPGFNHDVRIVGGILAAEATDLLQKFFAQRRSGG